MLNNNNNSKPKYNNTLGKITTSLLVAGSIFVIFTSFLKKKDYVSYERLRQAYDGLSSRDYQ